MVLRAAVLTALGVLFSAWLVQRVELVLGGPYLAGAIHPELALAALPLGLVAFLALLGRRDRKSTRLNSSHSQQSRMPSSA